MVSATATRSLNCRNQIFNEKSELKVLLIAGSTNTYHRLIRRNNRYNGLLGALNWKMRGVLLDHIKGKSDKR